MGNLVVFSATRGDQIAYACNDEAHGLFTYHLLKKWEESGGQVTYGKLASYLESEVNLRSLLINDHEQQPTIKVSPVLENSWRDFSFMPSGL